MKNNIKTIVKSTYAGIANSGQNTGCCDNAGCCPTDSNSTMAENYDETDGYFSEADLSLGCGIPTQVADIKPGDTVLDLGSGAGNDVFVARNIVGESGKVIGIDMTPEMVIRAYKNNQKLGYQNVEFVLSEIENMAAIENESIDVVISNCVMNLVPNKEKAFLETGRVLKEGGHFSISDIVYRGYLPKGVLDAAELYAGCVSGASEQGAYLGMVKAAGFKNISIKKERLINLPDELLLNYISPEELADYKQSGSGLNSITIYADKLESGQCCETTGSGCC